MGDVRTTKAQKIAPSAANAVSASSGTGAWANGSYTQLLAATAAAAALTDVISPSGIAATVEIDVATGAGGSESVFATFADSSTGASTGGSWNHVLPSPMNRIASGARLAWRLRLSIAGGTMSLAVGYLESLDSSNDLDGSVPLKCVPSAANQVSITPSSSAFGNSSYVQLTAGIGEQISLVGLSYAPGIGNVDVELALATGAGGSETEITLIRLQVGSGGATKQNNSTLCRGYNVPANTRIASRMRKTGTDVTAWSLKLNYFDNTGRLMTPASLATGSGGPYYGPPQGLA